VFTKLDPDTLADRFARWVAAVPAPGRGVGRREPPDPRPAVRPRRVARDHHVPRSAGHPGPDGCGGDAGRGRVPDRDTGTDPGAGRGARGVRQGGPADPAGRHRRGVRPGGRSGVRRVRRAWLK
jgi:hypothetical protein